MEKGFIRVNRGIVWVKRKHKLDVLRPGEGELVFHVKNAFALHIFARNAKKS